MICSSTCTTASFLGAAGTCNETSGLCECPQGYHGKDDYAFYNDCHILIPLQSTVYVVCSVAASILFLHSIFGFVYLLCKWRFVVWWNQGDKDKQGGSEATGVIGSFLTSRAMLSQGANSLTVNVETVIGRNEKGWSLASGGSKPGTALKTIGNSNSRKRNQVSVRTRQKEILFAIALFFLYAVGVLLYYIPMLRGTYRWEGKWYQDFGAAKAVASIFSGLWLMAYVWFKSLPSVHLYGKLFDIHSVLLRWPNFVTAATVANIMLIDTLSFSFIFLLPQLHPEKREIYDKIALQVFVGFLGIFILYFLSLCNIVKKLFLQLQALTEAGSNKSSAASEEDDLEGGARRTGQSENSTSKRAKQNSTFRRGVYITNITFWVTVVLGLLALLAATFAAFVPFFRTRLHLSIGLVSGSASIVANFLILFFTMRPNSLGSAMLQTSKPTAPRHPSM